MENLKNKKKTLIITIILIFIFVSIVSIFHGKDRFLKNKSNILFSKIFGFTGELFKSGSTNAEKENKKDCLSNYYLSLETSSAADKLYIIKKNDKELYSDLIKIMNRKSPNKTSNILKLIRNIDKRKDYLSSIFNEIQKGKEKEIKEEVETLENIDTLASIKKIEQMTYEDEEYLSILPKIISIMDEKKSAEILFYIDNNIKKKTMAKLENKKRNDLEKLIFKMEYQDRKLEDIAKTYDSKSTKEVVKEIGNEEIYSMKKLSYIYMNLSIEKAAEVLAEIKNDEFVEELISAIGKEEELRKVDNSRMTEINEAVKFLREYNEKVDELVEVYSKMSTNNVAKVVENMMGNTKKVTSLEIDSSPIYEISDSTIILDVLSRMKKPTLSKIINNMDSKKASKLTQMLASP
ncbi:hypothetical protein [Anaerosalibacter massiliensis]|uniref:MgtE intracellular N domain protein n=1 Tax=Anaerosalibacter massiliensis TaxID=1347392 RepID=A0A9X2MK75_9FIRM|nr:hypothetical protein [Anaerosalibacter massiliensis]MCR2042771.1 hypothetical protein [Anaerosalibacter massiliensis]